MYNRDDCATYVFVLSQSREHSPCHYHIPYHKHATSTFPSFPPTVKENSTPLSKVLPLPDPLSLLLPFSYGYLIPLPLPAISSIVLRLNPFNFNKVRQYQGHTDASGAVPTAFRPRHRSVLPEARLRPVF